MDQQPEEVIRTWGSRDVALWLQEVGMGECAKDFRSNGVDGPALLDMNSNGLRIYPSLSNAAKRDKLKAAIARLPGSCLSKGMSRKSSGNRKRRSRLSMSPPPPPLPERPQPQTTQNQQYDDDEDEDFVDDDDSFDDSDFCDEDEDVAASSNVLQPPERSSEQSDDTIRRVQAKLFAFGLRDMENQQISATDQQYLDEYDDDEGDLYDVPPEYQYPYPPMDEDEGDIYDVPPEEAQGHFQTPIVQEPPQQQQHQNAYTTSAQPVTKVPQMRAPIRNEVATTNNSSAGVIQDDSSRASPGLLEKRRMFETNTADNVKSLPGKPNMLPPKSEPSTIVKSTSPKLPSKFPKNPQLPPKSPVMAAAAKFQHKDTAPDVEDGDDSALSNMPAYLRDRFMKSKQQTRIRKESKTQEELEPEVYPPPKTGGKLQKQQQKPITAAPKGNVKQPEILVEKAKPGRAVKAAQEKINIPDATDTGVKSVKDRMKMFGGSTDEEPAPPKSPKWGGNNSFDRKQPGISSVGKAAPKQVSKPKPSPEVNINPPLPSRNELPPKKEDTSVPPLPDRNTKPPMFRGFKSGSSKQPVGSNPAPVGKRPPMPIPPVTSYDQEDTYDPPTAHEPIMDENYDPPQFHTEEEIEENYDPPPLPNRPGPVVKGLKFPPKEDRKTSDPVLPPRLPNLPKVPAIDPKLGRRNTFSPLRKTPPLPEKVVQKQPQPPSSNPLEKYPWYHGDIDRRTIESALEREAIDGCFIVRNPSKADEKKLGFYSLSLWHEGKTRHLRIRCRADNKYVVGESKDDEKPFSTVAELVKHHKKTPLLLKSGGSTLLTCIPRM